MAEVMISCFRRIIDLEAFDTLLNALPHRQYMDVQRRLGRLNTFNPLRPYRTFAFNMRNEDERVCLGLVLRAATLLGGDLIEDKRLGSDHSVSQCYAKEGALPREGWTRVILKRATAARRSSMMAMVSDDPATKSSGTSATSNMGALVQQTLVGNLPMRENITKSIARMDRQCVLAE